MLTGLPLIMAAEISCTLGECRPFPALLEFSCRNNIRPVNGFQCICSAGYGLLSESPLSCTECGSGLYSLGGLVPCSPCPPGCANCEAETGSCVDCLGNFLNDSGECVCDDGYVPNDDSSLCVAANACIDFPCSTFSSQQCVDLAVPAPNDASGRICSSCRTGYSPYSVDFPDSCVSAAVLRSGCYCSSYFGWVPTACGMMDVRLCDSKVGNVTLICDWTGEWNEEDDSACVLGLSFLFSPV